MSVPTTGARNSVAVWFGPSSEYVVKVSVIVGGRGPRMLFIMLGERGSL
jgi:hypothetical protein